MQPRIGVGDPPTAEQTAQQQQYNGESAAIDAAQSGDLSYNQFAAITIGALAAINPAAGAIGAAVFEAGQIISSVIMKTFGITNASMTGAQYCAQHNPTGPDDPSWVKWTAQGSQATAAPGTFEAYIFNAIRLNEELQLNCKPALRSPTLLKFFTEQWNRIHAGPQFQYHLPAGLNSGNVPNPLAVALIEVEEWVPTGGVPDLDYFGPNPGSDPFITVNLGSLTAAASPSVASSSSTGTSLVKGIAYVGVAGLLGAAIYSFATKKSFVGVLKNGYRVVSNVPKKLLKRRR